jgi:hypothetical protein
VAREGLQEQPPIVAKRNQPIPGRVGFICAAQDGRLRAGRQGYQVANIAAPEINKAGDRYLEWFVGDGVCRIGPEHAAVAGVHPIVLELDPTILQDGLDAPAGNPVQDSNFQDHRGAALKLLVDIVKELALDATAPFGSGNHQVPHSVSESSSSWKVPSRSPTSV